VRESSDDRPLRDVWGLLEYLAWRLRRRAAKAAALWTAAAALAGLAAGVAVAAAVGLPPSVLFAALVLGAAAVGVAAGLSYRPRPSPMYLARLVERQRPQLKEALVTLVELAADASSDRTMQTALARRAGRILSCDPPHAFLPAASWRRPAWALVAGSVLLGAVLWLAKGTVVAPWLPGAAAGTPQAASATQGDEASQALARAGGADGRRGACAAAVRAGGGSRGDARGSTRRAPRKRDGEHEPARAGGARVRRGACAARDEGSQALARAGGAGVRRGARAARSDAGGGSRGDTTGSTRRAPRKQDGEHEPARAGGASDNSGTVAPTGGAAGERPRPRARPAGPPLPDRNPSEAIPENVLDTMRRRKPLMEGDDRAPDEAEPPRKYLDRMGVSPADERRYTTAWSHGAQGSGVGPGAAPPPGRVRTVPGQVDGRVLGATGNADARAVVVPARAGAGERGALIHAAEARVSPRLRAAVRAYFERIGRLGAGE